jgi:hypothetical protein
MDQQDRLCSFLHQVIRSSGHHPLGGYSRQAIRRSSSEMPHIYDPLLPQPGPALPALPITTPQKSRGQNPLIPLSLSMEDRGAGAVQPHR